MCEPSRNSGAWGPGTLVTTRLKDCSRVKLRAPSESSVVGVQSATWVSNSAPTALCDSFSSAVFPEMARNCSAGSGSASGSGTNQAETRLPSAPRSSVLRTLTGAITRKSRPVTSTRRYSKKRRTAPVTTVSTTSLSEPPRRRRTSFRSASGSDHQSKRRWGPTL